MFEDLEKFLVTEILEKQGVQGFSVSVVKDDKIIWSKGLGWSNVEKGIPASPQTVYRCASVSKPVIATGLLQLMEKGKFKLDDTVNEHLQKVKIKTEFKEQPTIRNLLSHTSGLPMHGDPTFFDINELPSLEEMIFEKSRAAIAVRPPNEEIVYSNVAFNIVGYLVGLFSGEPYPQYMKENLFDPLEMHSTAFEQTPEIRKLMAQPYNRRGPDKHIEAVRPWYGASLPEKPCGSLFSSVTDLGHFLIAHMNDGVYKGKRMLRSATLKEMHKLQAGAGASRSGYAVSWKRTWQKDRLLLSHTGGNLGWRAHVAFYPELKTGVAILTNNAAHNDGWRPPAREALHLILGGTLSFDPATTRKKVTPGQWGNLCGAYTRNAVVRVENRNLVLEREGSKAYLERLGRSRYLVHAAGAVPVELTFEFDEKGLAKQFDIETETYKRLVEDTRAVDEKADLIGTWQGRYVHTYGVFPISLVIRSQTSATATDMLGSIKALSNFKADKGRVDGELKFKNLPGYTHEAEELEAKLALRCIEGRLDGTITIGRSSMPLILSRA